MNEERFAQAGIEASQVLENEAYKEAMRSLKAQVIEQWKSCPVRDKEGQLLLLQLAKMTDKFEGILRGYVERGKDAQRRIELNELRNESALRRGIRKVSG
jgi:hypothetical protein